MKNILNHWINGESPEWIANREGLTVNEVIEIIRREWVAM